MSETHVAETKVETKLENKPEYTYVLLQETNEEECESWYYFIRLQGNEEAIDHLKKQLSTVDWVLEDGMSTFDLETDFPVCERTAKEMTKIDLNSVSFHRKFDGKLDKIDLGFKPNDSNRKKLKKAFKKLGYGRIDDYIGDEDLDPEDLVSHSENSNESGNSDSNRSEYSESESDSSSEESNQSEDSSSDKKKKVGKLPGAISKVPIPRVAAAKQAKNLKNKNRDKKRD